MKLFVLVAFAVQVGYWLALRKGFRRAVRGPGTFRARAESARAANARSRAETPKTACEGSRAGFDEAARARLRAESAETARAKLSTESAETARAKLSTESDETLHAKLRAVADETADATLGAGHREANAAVRGHLSDAMPEVSVVVAARDEVEALPHLLDALAGQDHPAYEVIVVDDGSGDGTADLLDTWSARADWLRVLRAAGGGKKAALTRGIEAAQHDLLAFTDADCTPRPGWLSGLARAHAACGARLDEQEEASSESLLIGYSPFRSKGGFVGAMARYETFVTGFLTAAAAGLRRPYMAVGRNISYSRAVFDRVGGFEPIMHSLSGDDDLFVQEVVRRDAAAVCALLDPRTFVPTVAPSSLREWLRQKRRHTSGGRFYDGRTKAHLAVFHFSNLVVWLAPLLIGWMGAALLGARLLVQHAVLREASSVLEERDLMPIQPVLDGLYLLYNVLVAPVGLARMPDRW